MSADQFMIFPPWVDATVNAVLKKFVTPEKMAAALQHLVDGAWSHIDSFVKSTANPWDDAAAAKVKEALDQCAANGDADTLCKLLYGGKKEAVRIMRVLAANTATKIDDTIVDIFAKAIGVDEAAA